jgi:hypothetical protein
MEGSEMSSEHPELDELQAAYKATVESWISAIRNEETLVSANHSMAEIDRWEQAHLDEDEMRNAVKAAKGELRGCAAREVLRLLARPDV